MEADARERIRAIEEQIERLEAMRRRWWAGRELTEAERSRRDITLELLDGAIADLVARRDQISAMEE